LPEVAAYWEQVVRINDWQAARFVRNMLGAMFNTLADKRIALFGFAFKADTGDTRESPAIAVTRQLLAEHAQVAICDPKALDNAKIDLKDANGTVAYTADPYTAASGAHAIALMTDWKMFRDLDYGRLYEVMEKPAFVFDGRNLLDAAQLFEIGFNVYPLGRPALTHF
jgi:UDPglucose 6-dehydrogenase